MPTYETLPRFTADLQHLTPAQRRRFYHVVRDAFVPDLRTGLFRPGLRIKRVRRAPGVFELTWAPDGRATWSYGREVVAGARHIVWHRIGTHSILDRPLAEGRLLRREEHRVPELGGGRAYRRRPSVRRPQNGGGPPPAEGEGPPPFQ